jgi:hypothetical protein
VKTFNLDRARENLQSLSFTLTPEVVEELNSIDYKKYVMILSLPCWGYSTFVIRRYNDTINYTLRSGWLPIFCDF